MAAGLVLLMAGALGVHSRAKDPSKALAPAVLVSLLAAAYLVFRLLSA
ncbi:DoxX family protein [Streptomyces sp. GbtcB7]